MRGAYLAATLEKIPGSVLDHLQENHLQLQHLLVPPWLDLGLKFGQCVEKILGKLEMKLREMRKYQKREEVKVIFQKSPMSLIV
jgi:hypothetical protein